MMRLCLTICPALSLPPSPSSLCFIQAQGCVCGRGPGSDAALWGPVPREWLPMQRSSLGEEAAAHGLSGRQEVTHLNQTLNLFPRWGRRVLRRLR